MPVEDVDDMATRARRLMSVAGGNVEDAKLKGLSIGLITAITGWITAIPATPGRVSTFPDALSLVVLIVSMTIVFRRRLRTSDSRRELMSEVSILGASAGVVVGVSTALQGVLRWSAPSVTMLAVAGIGSLVAVIVIAHLVALTTHAVGRRGHLPGA